ncbi:MAG: signal peptidase I [Chlamydiales bacterium]|nr:signal peptidase I [Chlamydiales bacterium]
MSIFNRTSSLKKSRAVLRHTYHQYMRRRKNLPTSVSSQLEKALLELQEKILQEDRVEAHALALHVQILAKQHLKKSSSAQLRDLVFALGFALVVAILVRQVWFEFYEIPSGSMRPTLKEQDRLVVSKTDFGINIPLTTKQLYFDPELVQRGSIFIFTGEDMDIRDVDTLYFYLFPGKKQYIKRLMGRPGDTLYFYGGKIYGFDKNGSDISSQLQSPELAKIEHIPFLHFDGKVTTPHSPVQGVYTPIILHQMNEPVARLYVSGASQPRGEMLNSVSSYGDLWGFKNYGMTRLLTKEQLLQCTDQSLQNLPEAPLYLEIKHHPTLSSLSIGRDEYGRIRPLLGLSSSIIPLSEAQVRAIFDNMYTARFRVKDGVAMRYGFDQRKIAGNPFLPKLPGVPDGCYEFYFGKAYEVKWQGITEELPPSHPIYSFSPERVQLFYNVGIEMDMHFAPQTRQQRLLPSRYAYFRGGDLFLLGAPIFRKEDSTLIDFLAREHEKQVVNPSYEPFIDLGAPLKEDGSLNQELISKYGLTVPAQMYLALGDNHAMSADSRDFGFVPQGNLRGGPSFIFWPPGARWGAPNQPPYPFMNLPRAVVWTVAGILLGAWGIVHHRRNKLPLKF